MERLEYELSRNNRPACCIFLNGVNDVYQGVLYNNPSGFLYGTAVAYKKDNLFSKLRERSALFDLAVTKVDEWLESTPAHLEDKRKLASLPTNCGYYERNMLKAQRICRQHGVAFVGISPRKHLLHNLTAAPPYTKNRSSNGYRGATACVLKQHTFASGKDRSLEARGNQCFRY